MKKFIQLFTIVFLSCFLVSNAMASEAFFGLKNAKVKSPYAHRVVIQNYTDFDYDVDATYQPSMRNWDMHLGYAGSFTDTIVYDLYYPDYGVCMTVTREFDGLIVYQGCTSDDIITIGYSLKDKKPLVKFVHSS